MFDVVSCGELLVDFVALRRGVRLAEAPAFRRAAGGAPANVAVGVARLGRRAAFLGQVGDDDFGHYLAETLARAGVDVRGLRFSPDARTALAFVSLRADGERDFLFYRHPSADMLWRPEDVDRTVASTTRIFHFGSISLIEEPARSATLVAMETAREHGARLSYDPNLRLALWPSPEAARAGMLRGLEHAEIVKLSREELAFLTGSSDPAATRQLWHDRLQLLVVTLGAAGCAYLTPQEEGEVPGFTVPIVDTTGAGDGFVAGLLVGLLEQGFDWSKRAVEQVLRLANAVGALVCTRRGAIPALPTRRQVQRLLTMSGDVSRHE
ncbi:PfkB family carbohydrate kinase [Thermomicrobium sp. 4228-Ro]|uniref:PfkB family carbohydrate kinase n=1 Tax=Thermomicrobium sp. 4228-Ro TaxID=2993937 RepID=UPI00224974E5|nr:PfkB family carbohydrate kinase [Thermomicrobium sp. 4228-Ro]MCX2726988.1 PfkB family carbohydrate kinase [Thermomicrobium sp. 4228-Ro]